MTMDKTYDPHQVEQQWYERWEREGHFIPGATGAAATGAAAGADHAAGEPYCIMIPPPNVTGTLHMGHAFQDTIMDALIRYHRMNGRRTLWQPGTDHAGIATQMVVERQINAEGLTRQDLGRDAFVERIWRWKEHSGSTITSQMRRMGASVDWTHERFTMDEGLSAAVRETFVRLYEEGLIYRGKRLVNWDPVLQTAVSDLEVASAEEDGFLWHIRYPRADGAGCVEVATTRPETMLGDTAVAVHPADPRYRDLVGSMVELPLTDRRIPVVADEMVDPEFGTGCVKITPAHDFNDYQVGERHGLERVNVLTSDARMNANAPERYRGLDRFEARAKIVEDLEARGLLARTEPHRMTVPRGDRSQAVIEPWLTDQWFVKAGPLAEPSIRASRPATSASSPITGPRRSSSGCATSRTGASAARSGGGTGSPPGTTATATSTWAGAKRRSVRSSRCLPRSPWSRTPTCSTPGTRPRCGPSPPSAGRSAPTAWRPSTRPPSSSPASTSSSSGSPA